jgi:release factor glutamine methyltransferase
MQMRDALQSGLKILVEHAVPSPQLAAELLLMHTVGCDRGFLYSHPEREVPAELIDRYRQFIVERSTGKPTQYITGHQEFWGLDFEVTPDVLIPRPESEHIVEAVIECVRGADSVPDSSLRSGRSPNHLSALRIIDVGTGSGCLAVALALELSRAMVVATDLSAAALAVARRNAARLGFQKQVLFAQADLLGPFSGEFEFSATAEAHGASRDERSAAHFLRFDFVVSNPPYVGVDEVDSVQREVRQFEPRLAWGGLESAEAVYGRLIPQAVKLLKPRGYLVVEIGYSMAQRVRSLFGAGWEQIEVRSDLAGIPRIVLARKQAFAAD